MAHPTALVMILLIFDSIDTRNMIRDSVEREYSIFRDRRSQDPLQITQEIKRRDAIEGGSGKALLRNHTSTFLY